MSRADSAEMIQRCVLTAPLTLIVIPRRRVCVVLIIEKGSEVRRLQGLHFQPPRLELLFWRSECAQLCSLKEALSRRIRACSESVTSRVGSQR
jgi:hypothetical protein